MTRVACDARRMTSTPDDFDNAWHAARVASPIKPDEEVVVFPSLARRDEDGTLRFTLHVWVFEPEADGRMRGLLVAALERALDIASEAERSVFSDRVRRFIVDNEGRKRVTVRVGRRLFTLPKTRGDGHALLDVELSPSDFDAGESVLPSTELPIAVALRPDDERVMVGRVLLSDGALILVSDIDDTIKVSHVRDKKGLLRKTFLEEPEVVAGMATLYERLLGPKGHLHFVSSSPYQLFAPLERMCSQGGFRAASFGLKRIRPKGFSVAKLFEDPEESKPRAIAPLFERFPAARFILVGDTGEKDPEVYGNLYRQFGERIARILLRDVTQELRTADRYRAAMLGVPDPIWQLFADPNEIGA